jgi:hypothetical protein
MKKIMLILAFFLSGCSWDFKPVDEGYQGAFDYKTQNETAYTTTAVIEGDLVTISRSDSSTSSPSGFFRIGSFHVSSAVGQRNMADGAYIYVLYNGMEKIGYFNEGERDIFYIDESRSAYFIRQGSNATVGPEEAEGSF